MQHYSETAGIAPRAVVVMGVCASGKSTLGALLAARLNCRFFEGDAFHSAEAVAKMRSGRPLCDEDRWPWLDRLGGAMAASVAADGLAVAACSALKRSYRERLASAFRAPAAFLLLHTDEAELARRLNERPDHYMPVSLLGSQLAALETPGPDEPAIILDARREPEELCHEALHWLQASAALRV